jgi:hypothetical protein
MSSVRRWRIKFEKSEPSARERHLCNDSGSPSFTPPNLRCPTTGANHSVRPSGRECWPQPKLLTSLNSFGPTVSSVLRGILMKPLSRPSSLGRLRSKRVSIGFLLRAFVSTSPMAPSLEQSSLGPWKDGYCLRHRPRTASARFKAGVRSNSSITPSMRQITDARQMQLFGRAYLQVQSRMCWDGRNLTLTSMKGRV